MLHILLILTPLLVLGVVALLGFMGCDNLFGLQTVGPLALQIGGIVPTSGTPAGGTSVTLTGSGFDTVQKIYFGDAEASSVNVLSSTRMTAVTPAHAVGSVDVSPDAPSSLGTLQNGYLFDFVTHLQTVPNTANAGATQLSASLPDFGGGKLIIAAVQWGGTASVAMSGAPFTQLEMDNLNPQQVAIFFATNVSGAIDVIADLSAPSTTPANLLVTAYDFTGGNPDHPSAMQGLGTTATVPLQTASLSPGDLVYSFVIARTPGFILAGSLAAGTSPNFTPENGASTYHLVQDYVLQETDVSAGQIGVSATNTGGVVTSHWYIFAMRIPHA